MSKTPRHTQREKRSVSQQSQSAHNECCFACICNLADPELPSVRPWPFDRGGHDKDPERATAIMVFSLFFLFSPASCSAFHGRVFRCRASCSGASGRWRTDRYRYRRDLANWRATTKKVAKDEVGVDTALTRQGEPLRDRYSRRGGSRLRRAATCSPARFLFGNRAPSAAMAGLVRVT